MDGDAVHLGALQLEAVFKLRDGFVHAVHGQIVGQRAMAGDGDVLARAAHGDGVHVHDVVDPGGCGVQRQLNPAVFDNEVVRLLDRGRLALDVRQHGVDLGDVAQNLGFHCGDKAVRFTELLVFVDFDVQLDLHAPVTRLDAEIVHRNIVARGYGAHAIENALGPGFAGDGVDGHVGPREHVMHGGRRGIDQFAGVLKGESPRQSQREIGKVAGACAPHSRALHGQHAIHALHLAHQPPPGFRGDLIHQRAHRFMTQAEGHAHNQERNQDGRAGVGVLQGGDAEARSEPRSNQSGQHREGGPNV